MWKNLIGFSLSFSLQTIFQSQNPWIKQGIIRSTKAGYLSLIVNKLIPALEKRTVIPKSSILSSLVMSIKAWKTIPDKTFNDYFNKSGILDEAA